MARNELTWRLDPIDRCAYGRLEQKPTGILHNTDWRPKGSTGDGRCKAGKCTGTKTSSGRTAHPCQTVANSKGKAVRRGAKAKGRYEWTRDAVVNALEKPLLEEWLNSLRL